MSTYKIASWSFDRVLDRARNATTMGDKVAKPIWVDWLGRACILMEKPDAKNSSGMGGYE